MTPNPYSCLKDALESKGRSLSDQIILIGSRASGCARPDSDWDFICVTKEVSKIRHDSDPSSVQVILIHPWYIHQTELGVHAASHGIGITTFLPSKESLDLPAATKALRRRTQSMAIRILEFKTKTYMRREEGTRLLFDCIRLQSAKNERSIPANLKVTEQAKSLSVREEVRLYVECLGITQKEARSLTRRERT